MEIRRLDHQRLRLTLQLLQLHTNKKAKLLLQGQVRGQNELLDYDVRRAFDLEPPKTCADLSGTHREVYSN